MPDTLKLPRVLRAVIPLVRGEGFAASRGSVIDELVAFAHWRPVGTCRGLAWLCAGLLPCLTPIVGALDDLPEPTTGLRGVQSVWIDGRTFHMVDLPTSKVRSVDIPPFPFAVRRQDERALP